MKYIIFTLATYMLLGCDDSSRYLEREAPEQVALGLAEIKEEYGFDKFEIRSYSDEINGSNVLIVDCIRLTNEVKEAYDLDSLADRIANQVFVLLSSDKKTEFQEVNIMLTVKKGDFFFSKRLSKVNRYVLESEKLRKVF